MTSARILKVSSEFLARMGLPVLVGALLACAGSTRVPSLPPRVTLENVQFVDGGNTETASTGDVQTSTPSTDSWVHGKGLPAGQSHVCGAPVVVTDSEGQSVHGRLIIYNHLEDGQGPAGKGNYLVSVPDSRISATSGGRISVAYELYDSPTHTSAVAWVVFLSSSPLSC